MQIHLSNGFGAGLEAPRRGQSKGFELGNRHRRKEVRLIDLKVAEIRRDVLVDEPLLRQEINLRVCLFRRRVIDNVAAYPGTKSLITVRYLLCGQSCDGLEQTALALTRSPYDGDIQRIPREAVLNKRQVVLQGYAVPHRPCGLIEYPA